MKAMESDWYKKIWTLDIQNQSWVEDTNRQVNFLIDKLELKGNEKILDLACGFGRHSLELARRGYDVTGVDITSEYIEYATKQAQVEKLNARFICSDIRDVSFNSEFDVVLNMADGAIGYLENEEENLKIFRVISKALKSGGRHFMDIMNGNYAETHFPCKLWDEGEKCLTLSNFEWDKETKTLIYGQLDYPYGEPLPKPEMIEGNPIRLYSLDEIKGIFSDLGMSVYDSYADFSGTLSSDNHIQLMVFSKKI
ncbi:MAG: class I SAM-dependent methyltransferase [Lachnospiraceae bacterium]